MNVKSVMNEKKTQIERIKERAKDHIKNIEISFNETNKILDKVNEITDFLYIKEIKEDVEITFDSWGKYISITNVKDTKLFNNFVIALTELYDSGDKEAWGDGVRYSFEGKVNESDFFNSIHVSLTVKINVTGCKLIKETVVIPEKITPEHTEEKITVKCE
jgi:hypothetical protein